MIDQESVEQQVTSAPQSEESQAPSLQSQEAPAPEEHSQEERGSDAPTYAPSFKYKHLGEEHDFDEWIKPAIKDHKTELAIKELYEKAKGLEHVKPKYQKVQEEYNQVKSQYEPLVNDLQLLGKALKEKDFDRVMNTLGVSDDDIFNYVSQKLRYNQLDPDQKAAYDQQRQVKDQAWKLEQENQLLKNQFSQMQLTGLETEMTNTLSDPQVSQVAQAFDTRAGNQGAFKMELARRGDYYWKTQGVYKSPRELAQELLVLMGTVPQTSMASQPAPASQLGAPREKPVIPNISGGSASVVKQKPRSLADLKKIRASLAEDE